MSTGYKIRNQQAVHFVTFAVVEWVDVFTRREYTCIVVESLILSPPKRPSDPCLVPNAQPPAPDPLRKGGSRTFECNPGLRKVHLLPHHQGYRRKPAGKSSELDAVDLSGSRGENKKSEKHHFWRDWCGKPSITPIPAPWTILRAKIWCRFLIYSWLSAW